MPASWVDTRHGATVRVGAEVDRLFCPACKATRTVRAPGLHPTRDMTLSLVAAVLRDAAAGSCSSSAARHGVHRQAVSALVDEALAGLACGDLPGDVAVFAQPGAGGALLAVGMDDGAVLDAFSGLGDPGIAAFLDRAPQPALHCDWAAACAFRGHAAAKGRASMPAASRVAWLSAAAPLCDAAFAAALPRRAAARARTALALGARHPLSLSMPEAASLGEARAADADLRLHLDARSALAGALGIGAPAAAGVAYARWLHSTRPATLACFSPVTAPLGRMADLLLAGDEAVDPGAWLAATAVALPGLVPSNTRLALLRLRLAG